LAAVRIAEAKVLLDAKMWDGAYYLAGYAVECALKACIAKRTKAEEFPPKRKVVEDCYSHDLNTLLRVAGLEGARDAEAKANAAFEVYWTEVIKWNEQARYEPKSQVEAEVLFKGITDPTDGVLRWIQLHW
jgi:HEPN domain-containing protein